MNSQDLVDNANALVAGDKGLLAMDESTPTCNRRFAKLGIPQTEAARRSYRGMIVTTPGLGEFISGAILYDETIRHSKDDGTPFIKVLTDAGIIPGIKVDTGAKDMAGHPSEKITEGLDGLRERLGEYHKMGARFAKWRAVITIGDDIPSRGCIEANAQALARYAALCQESGLVPIVEPEVLMKGTHSMQRCFEVTEEVLRTVFHQLYVERVTFEAMILKPNMVLPGLACSTQDSVAEVAEATVKCLLRSVPAAVPGIAFLSGGQSPELASARLNAMNAKYRSRLPWPLLFSFGRALQQPALRLWQGDGANAAEAQRALYHRANCNSAARRGMYDDVLERSRPNKQAASSSCSDTNNTNANTRKTWVVGNWKMHTTALEAERLATTVRDGVGDQEGVVVVLCPPFPYLQLVGKILKGSRVALGAQNLYPENDGAFTGEVSPQMLVDLGCTYVILGHSERRHTLGESDSFINKKVLAALVAGLEVILCVGETLEQRNAKQTESVLDRQLQQGLSEVPLETVRRVSIAYEPVWAIGGGHEATPQQIEDTHSLIRRRFGRLFGDDAARTIAIQYGGSVVPENSAALLCRHGVDGALIGGASLHADQFLAIVRSAHRPIEAMRH